MWKRPPLAGLRRERGRAGVPLALVVALLGLAFLAVSCRPTSTTGWSGPNVVGDRVYLGTTSGLVVALDKRDPGDATGAAQALWTYALDESNPIKDRFYATVVSRGGILYAAGYNGRVVALSAGEGSESGAARVIWSYQTNAGRIVGDPAVDGAGTVYVGGDDGILYAIGYDGVRAQPLWTFETQGKVAAAGGVAWGAPLVADGVVYVGSMDHHVYAINADDGSEVWRVPLVGAVAQQPFVEGDRVYIGDFSGRFFALDLATGAEIWSFEDAAGWYWAKAVAQGDVIYLGNTDGHVYALDKRTGRPTWAEPYDAGAVIRAAPVLVADDGNGVLVVGARRTDVLFVSPVTGKLLGIYPIEHDAVVVADLSTDGETVFAKAFDGKGNPTLHAINARTYQKRWIVKTDDFVKPE